MPTALQWKNSGLVPSSGMIAWHMHEAGVSSNDSAYDYSGNDRHLVCENPPFPIITPSSANGQPGWLFDGVCDPLVYNGPGLTFRHIFLLISCTDAVFSDFRGVLSAPTTQTILTGNNGTTDFFDLSGSFSSTYRKTNIVYAANNQEAPVGGAIALVEIAIPGGFVLGDGIQIGQQINLTARKHKGFFIEGIYYSSLQNQINRERVMLYFNLKFAQQKVGLPFYFPSDDLLDFRRNRFYAEPPNYSKITDSFEFEDGGKTFNEVGDIAPRRWEYDYLNRTPDQVVIFDEFYNQARIANPFIFRDKYGIEHSDVRIESYNRNHDGYKSWKNDARFKLIKYPS